MCGVCLFLESQGACLLVAVWRREEGSRVADAPVLTPRLVEESRMKCTILTDGDRVISSIYRIAQIARAASLHSITLDPILGERDAGRSGRPPRSLLEPARSHPATAATQ